MPAYQHFIPANATNIKIVSRGREYPIDPDTHCFTRAGEDENSLILPVFGGDEMTGSYLNGEWKKNWDTDIDGGQEYSAILDTAGVLEFMGDADVAGVQGSGWLNCHSPIPLLDRTEITVAMSVPTDDTGSTASRDIYLEFYLREDTKATNTPLNDNNYFNIRVLVDEVGTLISLREEVGGSVTVLDQGYDYTMGGGKGTGDIEGTIWRIVIHDGDPSATSPQDVRHMHVFLKQNADLASAEESTENELDDSPYDISGWLLNLVHPAFLIRTENATVYESGTEAKIGYIKVDYPDFNITYDLPEASRFKNEAELWEGDPDSGGKRVYDVDHVWDVETNGLYLQNGNIRVVIPAGTANPRDITSYAYYSAAWNIFMGEYRAYLEDSARTIRYPYLLNVECLTPEKIQLRVRVNLDQYEVEDTSFVDYLITLKRGWLYWEAEVLNVVPLQDYRHYVGYAAVITHFGLCDSGELYDYDITFGDADSASPEDNFVIMFDEDYACILVVVDTKKPTGHRVSSSRVYNYTYDSSTIVGTKFFHIAVPWAYNASLFSEAEGESVADGATVVSPGVGESGGSCVLLNANGENCGYRPTIGTDIPVGRYLLIWRDYGVGTTVDYIAKCYYFTDGKDVNEEGDYVTFTAQTDTWTYRFMVFDALDEMDTLEIRAPFIYYNGVGTDAIYIDYYCVLPLGNGQGMPTDLAHAAMRTFKQELRHFVK